MTNKKIVAIGLEAVEPPLLEKWCDEGLLPTIAALRQKGAYRRMRSPAEVSSGATWSSINCGVTPGKHGMGFCHRQYKNGTYSVRKKRADEVGRLPFWTKLPADKKVFTMDVPETRTYDLNGTELVGWGLEYKAWKADSTPKGMIHKVAKEFGEHPLDDWYQTKAQSVDGWLDLKKKVLWATRTRTKIVKSFLEKENSDFTLVAYAETHFGGHLFWHLNDPDHPEYSAEVEKAVGNPILEIYQACDEGIREIMELDPDATYFIFSNTGIGPNYSARHFTGEALRRLGYRAHSPKGNETNKSGLPSADVFAVEKYEKMFGQRNIQRVKALVPEKIWDTVTRKFLLFGSDWKDSIAYDIPGDNTGTIRINLKGREPAGLVAPGAETEALYDELSQQLSGLVNPRSGRPLVKRLWRLEEWYEPGASGEFPDFFVEWHRESYVDSAEIPGRGVIQVESLSTRTGDHENAGLVFMQKAGLQADAVRRPIDIEDFAPTFCGLLGVDASRYDGRPIWALAD